MDISKTFLAVRPHAGFALEKLSIERESLKLTVQSFIEMRSARECS